MDHCKSLSNIAIKKGCDLEDSSSIYDFAPNLLFNTVEADWTGIDHDGRNVNSTDLIDIFLDYGCCIEQKNCDGMTPFLFTASEFWRSGMVSRIKSLLRRRAYPHAIDNKGGGALHVVLWAARRFWLHTDLLVIDNLSTRSLDILGYRLYRYDDFQREDCDDLHSAFYEDLDTMQHQMRSERADRSGIGFWFEDHPAEPLDNDNSGIYATGSDGDVNCGDGSDGDGSDGDGSDGDGSDGDGNIGEIYWTIEKREMAYRVYQLRLRLMLFELLQAGCDPNLLDFEGKSPSHYAQPSRLWRHWTWALKHTGYVYEESTDAWVKPSQFDDMLEVMNLPSSLTAGDCSGLDASE